MRNTISGSTRQGKMCVRVENTPRCHAGIAVMTAPIAQPREIRFDFVQLRSRDEQTEQQLPHGDSERSTTVIERKTKNDVLEARLRDLAAHIDLGTPAQLLCQTAGRTFLEKTKCERFTFLHLTLLVCQFSCPYLVYSCMPGYLSLSMSTCLPRSCVFVFPINHVAHALSVYTCK